MDRRRFLKVTAVTGTTAALSACGNPENQLVRFIPDDTLAPGIAEWKPSICPLCAAGCGVQARVMDGDAEVLRQGVPGVVRAALVRKLEGDPAHPISQGALCVRGQAAVQVTYHPDRLAAPMKRTNARGGPGAFADITWDEALAVLAARLDAARGPDRASVAWIGRPQPGRRTRVVEQFMRGIGAAAPIWYEPFDDEVLRRANAVSFGRYQLPTFDLAAAHLVMNFGSDILGTWNSPLAHAVAYGRMRRNGGAMFVQIEPRLSQTGASADAWVAVRPGTEGAVALGLAHVIIAAGLRSAADAGAAGEAIDGWRDGLPEFSPAAVHRLSGVPPDVLERHARAFASRQPAVAIIGGQALAHVNGLAQALAVNALNALVGAVGAPGGVHFTPRVPRAESRDLLAAMREDPPAVLILDGANPVHSLPSAAKAAEWIGRVPFVASVGTFVDDSAAHADLLLPDHSFLESWVDADPESGSLTAARHAAGPAMRPLYDTRATGDVLIQVAARLARPLDPPLPWPSFEAAVQEPTAAVPPDGRPVPHPSAVRWTPPAFDGSTESFPLHFLPYASQAFGDGATAHLPWLQELPDPLTTAMWSSWVEIHPATAAALGIGDGDLVTVASAHGTLDAPAVLSPGIAPDAVAMPAGQGHGTFTRYASGRGANPFGLLAPATEAATGRLAWAATRVSIAKASTAGERLILFGGATRERPEHLRGRS